MTTTHLNRSRRAPLFAGLAAALLCALPAQAEGPRAPKPDSAAIEKTAAQATNVTGVVNLNDAAEAELLRLPGIGPSKAKAILSLRSQMKRFTRVEDIMRVKGIGRKTFRKLRPMLTIEGATTLQTAAKTRP